MTPHYHIIKKIINIFENFQTISLTGVQRALIRQDLEELIFKTGQKDKLTIEVGRILEQYPHLRTNASNLVTISGISKVSAAWILAEIGS